jgi:hypothetical protein
MSCSKIKFKITPDELADSDYFKKWIKFKSLSLVVFDNDYWKESNNPFCAIAQGGQIEIPKECFSSVKNNAVEIDFTGCSDISYHRIKHNREYKASSLSVSFEIQEQIYTNRPGYRQNNVSVTWYDQIGVDRNCSEARFYTQVFAPEDSRISPSLEDVKTHLGKTFKISEI